MIRRFKDQGSYYTAAGLTLFICLFFSLMLVQTVPFIAAYFNVNSYASTYQRELDNTTTGIALASNDKASNYVRDIVIGDKLPEGTVSCFVIDTLHDDGATYLVVSGRVYQKVKLSSIVKPIFGSDSVEVGSKWIRRVYEINDGESSYGHRVVLYSESGAGDRYLPSGFTVDEAITPGGRTTYTATSLVSNTQDVDEKIVKSVKEHA